VPPRRSAAVTERELVQLHALRHAHALFGGHGGVGGERPEALPQGLLEARAVELAMIQAWIAGARR
jgi:hypothetical protein